MDCLGNLPNLIIGIAPSSSHSQILLQPQELKRLMWGQEKCSPSAESREVIPEELSHQPKAQLPPSFPIPSLP